MAQAKCKLYVTSMFSPLDYIQLWLWGIWKAEKTVWRKLTLEYGCWRKERIFQVARSTRTKGQNRFEDGWLYRRRSRKWVKSLHGALRPSFLNCLMACTPHLCWMINFLFTFSFYSSLSSASFFLDHFIMVLFWLSSRQRHRRAWEWCRTYIIDWWRN